MFKIVFKSEYQAPSCASAQLLILVHEIEVDQRPMLGDKYLELYNKLKGK